MLDTLASALLEIRRESRGGIERDFQAWSLEILGPVLGYDAAFWGTGAYVSGNPILHTSVRHRLPPENEQLWNRYRHLDECVPLIMGGQGKVVAINQERLGSMALYEKVWKPFGIVHLVSAYRFEPDNGLYEIVSFYRKNVERPFTSAECALADALISHLSDAYRVHRLGQLSASTRGADPRYRALADRNGILHSADSDFAEGMGREWPQWCGPLLPTVLIERLGNETAFRWAGERIIVDVQPAHEPARVSVEVRPVNRLDRLTAREHQVARLFCSGLSHKEVARRLSISPSTVRVHLAAIYKKAEVDDKAALTRLLLQLDHP